jgi:hypothetical protein
MLDRVCEGLISGKSIVEVCKPIDMPSYNAVYLAMAKDAEFAQVIARAREAQQEVVIDETIALADTATPENHNAVKLQIWARQWRASKLAPKKYGDKVSQELTGKDGAALIPVPPQIDDKMRAEALMAFFARTKNGEARFAQPKQVEPPRSLLPSDAPAGRVQMTADEPERRGVSFGRKVMI